MNDRRDSKDGFNGSYPRTDDDWVVRAYREAGMEPPWLLEYEDGKVVGPRKPRDDDEAPTHEA